MSTSRVPVFLEMLMNLVNRFGEVASQLFEARNVRALETLDLLRLPERPKGNCGN